MKEILSRPTALIVEDNYDWQANIAHILSPEYDIIGFVAHGDEVVETARLLHPDLITLDISLPGTSGLNLLPALRAALPDAVIIMLTTTFSKVYVDEAYRRGASGYVLKGKALSELLPAARAAVVQHVPQLQRKA